MPVQVSVRGSDILELIEEAVNSDELDFDHWLLARAALFDLGVVGGIESELELWWARQAALRKISRYE